MKLLVGNNAKNKQTGFEVKVVTPENYVTSESGLIYRDFEVGQGECPKSGQQVLLPFVFFKLKVLIFHDVMRCE